MAVADTSFLVALFDQDDDHHDHARRLMRSTDHVLISTETLIETLGVLKAKLGRQAAKDALEGLIRLENVGWEEQCDIMNAYRLYHRRKTRSLVDAIVIHNCVRLGVPPLTFDKRLAAIVEKMV